MGLLSPYRVIDLADTKGMFASKLLADMGATVIRIEPPGVDPDYQSLEFAYLNAGKKRVSLDLTSAKGRELFSRMVKTTDVVVETYPPGYLKSLDLEYQQLVGVSPQLIMASITPFGQSGPYRDYRDDDLVLQAIGGWLSLTGQSGTPLKLYGNQAYYTASLFAVNGILLALYERHSSRKGQHLDISVMECVASTLDYALPAYLSGKAVSGRQGSRYSNNAFHVFRCQDGHIMLSLTQHWETLVEWLDSEGMADDLTDEKWKDRDERNQGIDHIIDILQHWTLTHNVAELEEKGQLMHFPWAGIRSIPQLLSSPQLEERCYFTDIEVAGTNKRYRAPGVAVKMSSSPWQPGSQLDLPGESNRDVFQGELGLTKDEITLLSKERVI
jgi:benzylsuccinate CoA-transferase BbsE subunit